VVRLQLNKEKEMNIYKVYDPKEMDTAVYEAIAADKAQVSKMATDSDITLKGLYIKWEAECPPDTEEKQSIPMIKHV